MTKPTKEETEKFMKVLEDVGFSVMHGQEAHDWMNEMMNKPENVKAREENATEHEKMLAAFFAKDHKYKWLPGMDEISGMGGSYEQGCRAMVIAGLEYWDAHPDLDPQYKGWEGVYGILADNNEDAKRLDDAVMDAVQNDCTGAMHQAAISDILWIKRNSWEKFTQEMKKRG